MSKAETAVLTLILVAFLCKPAAAAFNGGIWQTAFDIQTTVTCGSISSAAGRIWQTYRSRVRS